MLPSIKCNIHISLRFAVIATFIYSICITRFCYAIWWVRFYKHRRRCARMIGNALTTNEKARLLAWSARILAMCVIVCGVGYANEIHKHTFIVGAYGGGSLLPLRSAYCHNVVISSETICQSIAGDFGSSLLGVSFGARLGYEYTLDRQESVRLYVDYTAGTMRVSSRHDRI